MCSLIVWSHVGTEHNTFVSAAAVCVAPRVANFTSQWHTKMVQCWKRLVQAKWIIVFGCLLAVPMCCVCFLRFIAMIGTTSHTCWNRMICLGSLLMGRTHKCRIYDDHQVFACFLHPFMLQNNSTCIHAGICLTTPFLVLFRIASPPAFKKCKNLCAVVPTLKGACVRFYLIPQAREGHDRTPVTGGHPLHHFVSGLFAFPFHRF